MQIEEVKISDIENHPKKPGLKLIVSYADVDQNHTGGIYQAGNWVYVGLCNERTRTAFIIHGKKTHNKTIHSRGVIQSLQEVRKHLDPKATEFFTNGKHKYLYPLTDDMRSKIEPLRKPYPKRASVVHAVEQPAYQQGEGGSIPTLTHSATGKEPELIA